MKPRARHARRVQRRARPARGPKRVASGKKPRLLLGLRRAMFGTTRKLLGLVAVASGLLTSGCSDQGEGERCDFELSGNTDSGQGRDCESGLECVSADQLLVNDGTDRCCPPSDQRSSDERCRRGSVAPAGTGGSASAAAGAAGTSGAGPAGVAGSPVPVQAGAGGAAGSPPSPHGGQSAAGAAGASAGSGG